MSRQAPPNGVGFNVFPVAPAEYCGKGICAALAGHDGTCDEASGWSENPEDYPCGACGAERFEPCRFGCLGAVAEDEMREAESDAAGAQMVIRLREMRSR